MVMFWRLAILTVPQFVNHAVDNPRQISDNRARTGAIVFVEYVGGLQVVHDTFEHFRDELVIPLGVGSVGQGRDNEIDYSQRLGLVVG
jgi:hypothetical protein